MDNLKEIDKFLETYTLPRLNHKEIENLLIQSSIQESKKFPVKKRKAQDQIPSPVNSTKYLKKNLYQYFSLFQKIRERDTPKLIYKVSITLIPKPDKNITKKENYRSISLMNIHAKILNKILANQLQQHIKRIIPYEQMEFIPGMQG